MKPIAFLLLFSGFICQVIAQDQINDKTPLPENTDKTAATTGTISCPHCSPDEQLIVDLNYYKQVLNIIEQIDQQRNKINAGLLQSVHAVLVKTRPELETLLKPNPKSTSLPPSPIKKAEKPAKKPVASVKKPLPKPGIEGLIVGHVNEENKELGIKASVVLVSNGRPRSLNTGGVIEHNQRSYKVLKVHYVEDLKQGNRHEVHLQEQTSKKIHIVPWK